MRAGFFLIVISAIFSFVRLLVPTVGHSWTMVFITAAHIFVGVMLTLLWQRRGRWPLGWICLSIPTIVEAAMFAIGAAHAADLRVIPHKQPMRLEQNETRTKMAAEKKKPLLERMPIHMLMQ